MTGGAGRKNHGLDGRTWLRYSISVWDGLRKSPSEAALAHPAMFPAQLARRLIRTLTEPGDLVLDPFVGSGSTLLAALAEGRRGLGMDISAEYVQLASSRLEGDARVIQGDAADLGSYVEPRSVDLCVTSPPYWNILSRRRSADRRDVRDYDQGGDNIALAASYPEFLAGLGKVFQQVYVALKPGCRIAVVVMDIRRGPSFYPLHMDLSLQLEGMGFELEDIIIWDRRGDYNRLRPLGYPHVFRVNKVHEYILLFRRRPGT